MDNKVPFYRVWHKERGLYFDHPAFWGEHPDHLSRVLMVNMDGRVFWYSHKGLNDITDEVEVHWTRQENLPPGPTIV